MLNFFSIGWLIVEGIDAGRFSICVGNFTVARATKPDYQLYRESLYISSVFRSYVDYFWQWNVYQNTLGFDDWILFSKEVCSTTMGDLRHIQMLKWYGYIKCVGKSTASDKFYPNSERDVGFYKHMKTCESCITMARYYLETVVNIYRPKIGQPVVSWRFYLT